MKDRSRPTLMLPLDISVVVKTGFSSADRELRTCFDCQIARYFDKRCPVVIAIERISIEIEKHRSVAISRKLFGKGLPLNLKTSFAS